MTVDLTSTHTHVVGSVVKSIFGTLDVHQVELFLQKLFLLSGLASKTISSGHCWWANLTGTIVMFHLRTQMSSHFDPTTENALGPSWSRQKMH